MINLITSLSVKFRGVCDIKVEWGSRNCIDASDQVSQYYVVYVKPELLYTHKLLITGYEVKSAPLQINFQL